MNRFLVVLSWAGIGYGGGVAEFISNKDERFPTGLQGLEDAPERLYYRGKWRGKLFERCLAVVGSRRMSGYGRRVTERLVFEAASRGITIVSGFMYGVDATAHKAALAAGGKTVAVVAFGIKKKPLGYMKGLYEDILSGGGLILSEHGSDEPPRKFMFPKRNRIIAGLSQAVLVVEAAEKSGSLITAGFARKYGRKLLAVPGPIDSKNSAGTLELIRQGVVMVKSIDDVMTCFGDMEPANAEKDEEESGNDLEKNALISLLEKEPLTIEQIADITKEDPAKLSREITMLTLSGLIKEEGGRFHAHHS